MKMKTSLFLMVFILTLSFSTALASTYLEVGLKLKEGIRGDSLSFSTVDEREFEIKEGVNASMFAGNFTLNINFQKLDSTSLNLNLSLCTLAPEMEKIFKNFLIGLEHTYIIKDIKLKKDRVFWLELTPRRFTEREDHCSYLITDTLWFYKPSVHYAFTFMENSLAEFFYNMNKNHLELDYDGIKRYFKFDYPQTLKIDYFIRPCEIPEAVWDQRLNISLAPSKHKIYVLFDKEKESVDFPGHLLLLIYEYWGYAPAFVAEGVSGYLELSHYYAKKFKEEGSLIPLSQLKISSDYRKAPVQTALIQAYSFISYLIDIYSMDKFKKFYAQVTDIDFDPVFEEVYDKTFSQMEKEWLSFLDKYKWDEKELEPIADRRLDYRYYAKAAGLLEDALKIYSRYSERENILRILNKLGGAYFSLGDYKEAQRVYKQKTQIDTLNAGDHFILGSLYLLQGEKDSARIEYLKALSLDSNYAAPQIKLGEILLGQGNFDQARQSFEKAKSLNPGVSDWAEIYSGLAEVYSAGGDSLKAQANLYLALQSSTHYLSTTGGLFANPYVKIGELYLSLGVLDSALVTFQIAEFLEDRPFYLGKIFLNLGKVYELKGEKEKAKDYYQQVLQLPSGYEEKLLAQERLKLLE